MATKKRNLEENFEYMEAVIKQLEEPDISLEDSFKLYQEGMNVLKTCNAEIDKVEKQVQVLNEAGEKDEL